MQLTVAPPFQVVYAMVGLPLLVALVVVFLKRHWIHKVLAVLIAGVACGAVLLFALKPLHFSWDEAGIVDAAFPPSMTIPWQDVTEARLIRNFYKGPMAPRLRTHGTAYGVVRSGYFRLANGITTRVFLLEGTRDALWLRTPRGEFLYAPTHFEDFLLTARRHLPEFQP